MLENLLLLLEGGRSGSKGGEGTLYTYFELAFAFGLGFVRVRVRGSGWVEIYVKIHNWIMAFFSSVAVVAVAFASLRGGRRAICDCSQTCSCICISFCCWVSPSPSSSASVSDVDLAAAMNLKSASTESLSIYLLLCLSLSLLLLIAIWQHQLSALVLELSHNSRTIVGQGRVSEFAAHRYKFKKTFKTQLKHLKSIAHVHQIDFVSVQIN